MCRLSVPGESGVPTYSPIKGDSSTPTYSPTKCDGDDCDIPAPVPAEDEVTTTEPTVAAIEEEAIVEPALRMPTEDSDNDLDFAGATGTDTSSAALYGTSMDVVAGMASTWMIV